MNNSRKVLIIVENLPVPFDTRVWQEAKTLSENGYTVSVICPRNQDYNDEYEFLHNIHIYRYNPAIEGNTFFGYLIEYVTSFIRQFDLAKKIYKDIGFEVIHGCNPPDNIFLIARKFRKFGVDFIFDHHDLCPELYEAKFNFHGPIYMAIKLLERLTFRSASISLATNMSYRDIAIKRGKMCPDNVKVVRSGPSFERFKIKEPNPALKQGKHILVGYVGVIGKQEGLDYLLKCAEYIKHFHKRDDILFVVCGDGPYLNTVKKLAEVMKLSETIVFTGRIPDEELLDYLNTADICVNPDEFNDMNDKSTMNKILEYMALAKPIVQFDLAEGRYSAQCSSLYALKNDYIDMALKIIELADDPDKRKFMGEYGRKRILESLSWEHSSRDLLDAYEFYYTKIRKESF